MSQFFVFFTNQGSDTQTNTHGDYHRGKAPVEISIPNETRSKDLNDYAVFFRWKLRTKKNLSILAFIQTITKLWNPRPGVVTNEIGKNFFLFQFKNSKDKARFFQASLGVLTRTWLCCGK